MGIEDSNERQAASNDDLARVQDDDLDAVSGGAGYAFTKTCLACGQPLKGRKKCPKCGFELPSRNV